MQPGAVVGLERLRVDLLDAAEAPELALDPVPVTVPVVVLGRQLAAGDGVDCLHLGHDGDDEGQRGSPTCGRPRRIGQGVAGGGSVGDPGDGTDVVVDLLEESRLAASGEVEEVHRGASRRRCIATPKDAAGAGSEQVRDPQAFQLAGGRRSYNCDRVAPAVAAAVDPHRGLAGSDVDEVREAVSVDIAEQQAPRVVPKRQLRARRHPHPAAPPAVAEVRPVFDGAIVDEDQVLQPVAQHVGKPHPWIGEAQIGQGVGRRGAGRTRAGPSLLRVVEEAGEPVAGMQRVGHPVASEIEQPDLGVL